MLVAKVYNMALYTLKHVILSHPLKKHVALSTNMVQSRSRKEITLFMSQHMVIYLQQLLLVILRRSKSN